MAQARGLLQLPARLCRPAPRHAITCSSRGVAWRRPLATSANIGSRSDLKVSQDRIWNDIHSSSKMGANNRWGNREHETGVTRPALSDSDREVREWFAKTTIALGCKLQIDEMGNMMAVRPGRKDGPPTCAGSHLDTQPTGGRYDGILGVCAAIEMLRVLNDAGVETNYPIGVINWTNEEGARFPVSMVSSGVWAGRIPLEQAHNLKEVGDGGKTMKEELERVGYLGQIPASYDGWPIASHFELHIEQGPRLESEKKKVGIVTGVQAYRWYTINVSGRDCHTGTTDFANRHDAMLAAARMIVASNDIARRHNGLASTGIVRTKPGSVNTVPGTVSFSLDLRAPKDEIVGILEAEAKMRFKKIASGGDITGPVKVEWILESPNNAVNFHEDCIDCVEKSTADVLGEGASELSMQMVSGAGHDSVHTNFKVPTSMIFVPCRGGISHNPEEYCSPEDCTLGAQVLMGAVLRYDELRASRDGN